MEQVLITGASGKLGRATVRELAASGYRVVAIDRARPQEPHPEGVQTVEIDLLDIGQVAGVMHGCDAVIHLGAIPNPYDHADEVVLRNNTGATFAVLQAASLLGIRHVAIASSGSIYGTAWSRTPLYFQYAPVDEAHPLMVHDVYALSKEVDERTAEMFCRREGMSIAALRFHWIATREEQLARVAERRAKADHSDEAGNLWGYVDLRDAARACRLAIEAAKERKFGFAPLQIVAADTLADEPTEELILRWSPVTEIRKPIPGTASSYDTTAAKEIIGWKAQHSWRDAG
jgi:nucleoside-diphosphate-sugar epimerase